MAIWQVAPRKFDDLVDQILYNRGIIESDQDDAKKLDFFKPDFDKDLHDPFLLKNCQKAAERIKQAIESGEKIGIFADYDADGIPGAALLYRTFLKLGLHSIVYIPNRNDGYGLSQAGLDYLKSKGCRLVVTVDLGIRSMKEALYAKKAGIDLIITDHHIPGDKIPSASLVVNPKQEGDRYPFKDLSGCGVAFKVAQGLSKLFPGLLDHKFLKWNLDLVAISTISDVVPLSGENRIFAMFGLIVIQKTKNLGLAELIKIADLKRKLIGAYAIGFQIGPRINAPGRIGYATESYELLTTSDQEEAKELAVSLNEKNEERQAAMDKAEKEAISYIEKHNLSGQKIIIIASDWSRGIIGPTASRIVEKYNRPVILFVKEKDSYTGSARSVSGINIVDILTEVSDTLEKFGGHAGAAGLSVAKAKFESFLRKVAEAGEKNIRDDDLIKKIRIDALVRPAELTKSLYEKLLRFEPFGMGNPRPVFAMENVAFKYPRFVGKGSDHLSASIGDGPDRLKVIHFNFPYEKSMINAGNTYDIVFSLGLDEWEGRENISLNVVDLKEHK